MISRHDPDAVNDSLQVLVTKNAMIDIGLTELANNVYGNRIGNAMIPGFCTVIHPDHQYAVFQARWLGHKALGHDVRRLAPHPEDFTEPWMHQGYPYTMICYHCWNRSIRKMLREGSTKVHPNELWTPQTFEEYCGPRQFNPATQRTH